MPSRFGCLACSFSSKKVLISYSVLCIRSSSCFPLVGFLLEVQHSMALLVVILSFLTIPLPTMCQEAVKFVYE